MQASDKGFLQLQVALRPPRGIMTKYALLFVGGLVPAERREQNAGDWEDWLNILRSEGKFVDGAPFGIDNLVVNPDGSTRDYDWFIDSNVGGYFVINVKNIDDAVSVSLNSPQLKPEYGSGTIEIREITDM